MTLTSPAPGDDHGQVVAAAHRTLTGPSVFGSIASAGPPAYADSFLLEPATGRCAISLSTILDDTTELYGADGARWARRAITPGSRDDRDPRLLLDLLRAGSFAIVAPLEDDGYGFHLSLAAADVGVLRVGGLAPDRVVTATVSLAAWSPVSSMSMTWTPPAGAGPPMGRSWTFAWFGPPVAITMPDPSVLIEHAEWVREQEEASYR